VSAELPPREEEPGRAEAIKQRTESLEKNAKERAEKGTPPEKVGKGENAGHSEKEEDDHEGGYHHKATWPGTLAFATTGGLGVFTLGGGIALGLGTEVVGGYVASFWGLPEIGGALIHGGEAITAAGKYMLYTFGPWVAVPAFFLGAFFAPGFVVDWVKGKITGVKPAKGGGGGGHGGSHGHGGGDHGHGGGHH
jgi:hypothetical protein